jgi:1-deoxy-D-xylulose-5-phosphate synthase
MTEQTLQELFPTLAGIRQPGDIQSLDEKGLVRLGEEIRRMIIQTVSSTGGHLAPSLGVVELTMALLRVSTPPATASSGTSGIRPMPTSC